MEITLSTGQVPLSDRNEFWRKVVCRSFVELEVTHDTLRDYRGMVRTRTYGDLRATRIACDPMIAARTPGNIRLSDSDDFLVALQMRGRTVGFQDGREILLQPGDFALFDSERPYRVDFQGPHFDHLVFQLSRHHLTSIGVESLRDSARIVRGDTSRGRLVATYLINLARMETLYDDSERGRFGQVAIDLLGSSLRSEDIRYPRIETDELLRRSKTYAMSRIADPTLDPAAVANAMSISVRQLHRVFSTEDATFSAWLRETRLTRCWEELADPLRVDSSIADIRIQNGFRDPSVFSRTFRQRFGVTPSERRDGSSRALR
ncbi:AraC-like ligand-binding domain-containing protein [Nocardioides sp. GXZ039]|uniref:AraC-like ligand-binding domain-containing protein n=1 Tax=Nocardioides sp. GXZ039 TaxID=3136018 RepID=UPI0030F43EAC